MADTPLIAFILYCCVTVVIILLLCLIFTKFALYGGGSRFTRIGYLYESLVSSETSCTKYNPNSVKNDLIYCSTSCCGDKYKPYCCMRVQDIFGIVFGVLGVAAIVVIVIRIVCCCCRKSSYEQGQVCQSARGVSTDCSRNEASNQHRLTSTYANQMRTSSHINSGQTIQTDEVISTVSGGTDTSNASATSTSRSISHSLTSNTNTCSGNQRKTSWSDTRIPFDPPPSYESLFKNS